MRLWYFFVLRKILQMRMRSHPVGLYVWFLVRPFVYFQTSCVWTVRALVRLRGCAGSSEPLLDTYVISTIIHELAQINAKIWKVRTSKKFTAIIFKIELIIKIELGGFTKVHRVKCPNSFRSSLVWVYTVCLDLCSSFTPFPPFLGLFYLLLKSDPWQCLVVSAGDILAVDLDDPTALATVAVVAMEVSSDHLEVLAHHIYFVYLY